MTGPSYRLLSFLERAALEWTRRYISHFGGDPKRVIMYATCSSFPYSRRSLIFFLLSVGQSAGAISIGLHMIANGGNTDGLFRGAVMVSAFVLRVRV